MTIKKPLKAFHKVVKNKFAVVGITYMIFCPQLFYDTVFVAELMDVVLELKYKRNIHHSYHETTFVCTWEKLSCVAMSRK